jgi:hypothetical protein
MKPMSALRNPAHPLGRTRDPARMSEASLEHGVVWTQLVLLALCAARMRADLVGGPRTIEGDMATWLAVFLAIALGARAIGWLVRLSTGGGAPRAPASSWTLGAKDAHAR